MSKEIKEVKSVLKDALREYHNICPESEKIKLALNGVTLATVYFDDY